MACGQSAEGASGSASAAVGGTSSGAATGAAAAVGCPDGAFKRADPGFCIQLPDGFKEGPLEERPNAQFPKSLAFDGPSAQRLVVSWGLDPAQYDRAVEGMKSLAKPSKPEDKAIAADDLPGGRGFFYQVSYGGSIGQAEVLVKGKGTLMKCYINDREANVATLLAACKTLASL